MDDVATTQLLRIDGAADLLDALDKSPGPRIEPAEWLVQAVAPTTLDEDLDHVVGPPVDVARSGETDAPLVQVEHLVDERVAQVLDDTTGHQLLHDQQRAVGVDEALPRCRPSGGDPQPLRQCGALASPRLVVGVLLPLEHEAAPILVRDLGGPRLTPGERTDDTDPRAELRATPARPPSSPPSEVRPDRPSAQAASSAGAERDAARCDHCAVTAEPADAVEVIRLWADDDPPFVIEGVGDEVAYPRRPPASPWAARSCATSPIRR